MMFHDAVIDASIVRMLIDMQIQMTNEFESFAFD